MTYLLEDNIIEIDYCVPVPGGLRIFMMGQTFKGEPFGSWKKLDSNGNIIKEFSENHREHIYGITEKEN